LFVLRIRQQRKSFSFDNSDRSVSMSKRAPQNLRSAATKNGRHVLFDPKIQSYTIKLETISTYKFMP